MVDLDTAINELNTGVIEFDYPNGTGCTTEGEVVILLKRLKDFESIGLEVDEIRAYIKLAEKMSVCDLVRENKKLTDTIRYLEANAN
ncbi:hypothetical protein [Lacrimispora amygdalina]|uniref:hypothetical protein n=1 Tax=Lacrimispora amygdalina TaxID=253257 RepID=UPI000BE4693A|nr:hypothetical protein [Lacrimispora amygdalina]